MSIHQKPATEFIALIVTATGAAIGQSIKGLTLAAQATAIPVLLPWQEALHVGQSAIIGSVVGSVIGYFIRKARARFSEKEGKK